MTTAHANNKVTPPRLHPGTGSSDKSPGEQMSTLENTALPAASNTTEWATVRETAIAQAAELIRQCEDGGLPIDEAVTRIGEVLRQVPPNPVPPTEAELAAALAEFQALRAFIDAKHAVEGVGR